MTETATIPIEYTSRMINGSNAAAIEEQRRSTWVEQWQTDKPLNDPTHRWLKSLSGWLATLYDLILLEDEHCQRPRAVSTRARSDDPDDLTLPFLDIEAVGRTSTDACDYPLGFERLDIDPKSVPVVEREPDNWLEWNPLRYQTRLAVKRFYGLGNDADPQGSR